MKKVVINNAEYMLKYTLRALFIYEELAGKPYSGGKMINSYILLCAMLMACNKEFLLTFDDVIDACDSDPSIFETFLSVLEDENKRINMIAVKDGDKKKVRKRNTGK